MLDRVRPRLSYANVVSTLCLFLLLGGGAYAALKLPKNSVGTKQIKKEAVTAAKVKKGTLTGKQINASTLGIVREASHAASADNASQLGGAAASAYAKGQLEPIHVVGEPGEPNLEHGCVNVNAPKWGKAGFYKDGFGIVHLLGALSNCTATEAAFTLPPGFRPSVGNFMVVGSTELNAALLGVLPNGEVQPYGTETPDLYGITFRAES
jgi:hypothetical protein